MNKEAPVTRSGDKARRLFPPFQKCLCGGPFVFASFRESRSGGGIHWNSENRKKAIREYPFR